MEEDKNVDTNEVDNDFKDLVSKKGHKLLIIICLIVVFSALLVLGYIYYNSASTIKRNIKEFKSTLNNFLANNKSNDNTDYSKILLSDTYTIKSDINVSSILGNFNISGKTISNTIDNTSSINYNIKANEEELFKIKSMVKDNKLYFILDKYMDKYYYLDSNITEEAALNNIFDAKLNVITNVIIDNISKQVKNTKITNELTTINIDNNDKKVRKITSLFNSELIDKTFINILKDFKEETVLNELTILFNASKDEVKTMIDDAINNINKDSKDITDINLVIYSEIINNKIVAWEINNTEGLYLRLVNNDNGMDVSFTSINSETKKEDFKLNVIIKNEDNKKDIDLSFINEGKETLTINGNINDKNEFKYTIIYDDNVFIVSGKYNTTSSSEEVKTSLELTIKSMGIVLIKLNTDTTCLKGGNVILEDTNNSKSLNDITDEEKQKIIENIYSDENIQELLNNFMSGMSYE